MQNEFRNLSPFQFETSPNPLRLILHRSAGRGGPKNGPHALESPFLYHGTRLDISPGETN
jgi:hypothetical protein